MDDDVKRKQARTRGLLAPPPTPRPLALPFGPGEVLDLTYSPPAQAFPAPSPFTFPALGPGPGSQLLGAPDTPDTPADPVALLHQGCEINFKEVLDAAGVTGDGYTFHSWRHTMRSRLGEAGADMETAKRLLGHTSDAMSLHYDHAEHLDELRAAVEAAEK